MLILKLKKGQLKIQELHFLKLSEIMELKNRHKADSPEMSFSLNNGIKHESILFYAVNPVCFVFTSQN